MKGARKWDSLKHKTKLFSCECGRFAGIVRIEEMSEVFLDGVIGSCPETRLFLYFCAHMVSHHFCFAYQKLDFEFVRSMHCIVVLKRRLLFVLQHFSRFEKNTVERLQDSITLKTLITHITPVPLIPKTPYLRDNWLKFSPTQQVNHRINCNCNSAAKTRPESLIQTSRRRRSWRKEAHLRISSALLGPLISHHSTHMGAYNTVVAKRPTKRVSTYLTTGWRLVWRVSCGGILIPSLDVSSRWRRWKIKHKTK